MTTKATTRGSQPAEAGLPAAEPDPPVGFIRRRLQQRLVPCAFIGPSLSVFTMFVLLPCRWR